MLIKSDRLKGILERAYDNKAPDRDEVKYMLEFDERSMEAKVIRAAADDIIRRNSENSAIILGQIGIDINKCPGGCKFCNFGDDHTVVEPARISDEELREKTLDFVRGGDLYGLYLMCMHDYDLDFLLHAIDVAKEVTPETTQLWVNIGDTDLDTFRVLKKAGVTGVYHVCRLGEGTDTKLDPKDRQKTMDDALGYTSGANIITAESGGNPRDTNSDTARGRGPDMDRCRRLFLECGFEYLRRGDETKIPLTLDYVFEKAR